MHCNCVSKSPLKPRQPMRLMAKRRIGNRKSPTSIKTFAPSNRSFPKTLRSTTAVEITIEQERTRVRDLEDLAARNRRQIAGPCQPGRRSGRFVEGHASRNRSCRNPPSRFGKASLADQQRALTALSAQLEQIRSENEQRRASHLEQLRTSAALANEISTLEGRLSRTEETSPALPARAWPNCNPLASKPNRIWPLSLSASKISPSASPNARAAWAALPRRFNAHAPATFPAAKRARRLARTRKRRHRARRAARRT